VGLLWDYRKAVIFFSSVNALIARGGDVADLLQRSPPTLKVPGS